LRFWRECLAKLTLHNLTLNSPLSTDFFKRKVSTRGRKRKWDVEELKLAIKGVELSKRTTVKNLSLAVKVPTSTLHRLLTEGVLKRWNSRVKPILSEQNKVARVLYCVEEIFPVEGEDGYHFKDFYDRVDIDEKWFYITEDKRTYILVEDEDPESMPTRRVQHKSYLTKVCFLCAQARPRFDPHGNAIWDGKIGIWPIGDYAPAQRSSSRRPRGTLEWKNESITKNVYRRLLLTKVVPAIAAKWPRGEWRSTSTIIRMQQDGPNSHIDPEDEEFNDSLKEMNLHNKVVLYTQPPNSPDLNINDLGFFAALNAWYRRFSPRNESDIIKFVEQSYAEYPKERINKIWLTLMTCMNRIIDLHGDNHYKIPHIGKDKLQRLGQLPKTIRASDTAYAYLEIN